MQTEFSARKKPAPNERIQARTESASIQKSRLLIYDPYVGITQIR